MDRFDRTILKISPPREKNFEVKSKIEEENPDYKEIFEFTYETYYPNEESKFGSFFLIVIVVIPVFWIILGLIIWDSRKTMNRVDVFYDTEFEFIYAEILFGKYKTKSWLKEDIDSILLSESDNFDNDYYNITVFSPPDENEIRRSSTLIELRKSPQVKRLFMDVIKKLQTFNYPAEY